MKIRKFPSTHPCLGRLLAAALLALNVSAQTEPSARHPASFALGVEAGTTGIGPVLHYTASPKLDFSLGYTYLGVDIDDARPKNSEGRYEGTFDANHVAALVNWRPTGGRFHFSAGAIFFDHSMEGTAKPINGRIMIGDNSYDVAQVTSLKVSTKNDSVLAPYLGCGWTWGFGDSGFSLAIDFGAMFLGDYDVKLTAAGPAVTASQNSPDAPLHADLRKEQRSLSDNAQIYPVAKIGIFYGF